MDKGWPCSRRCLGLIPLDAAGITCCQPSGVAEVQLAADLISNTTCTTAYSVTGIFYYDMTLGGSLVHDEAVWSNLSTMVFFIMSGKPTLHMPVISISCTSAISTSHLVIAACAGLPLHSAVATCQPGQTCQSRWSNLCVHAWTWIVCAANTLGGSLPAAMAYLGRIVHIDISNNQLTGLLLHHA